MNISEFFAASETVKVYIDKDHTITKNNLKYYPVYLILFASDTFVSKAIRMFTRSPVSHVGISFDSSMTKIFSFGFRTNENSLKDAGNRIESLIVKKDRWLYSGDSTYVIYVKFLSMDSITNMKKRIHDIYNNTEKYKFSVLGLFKYALHIPSESTYKMFCSQFVASLLQTGGVELDRKPSLYSPSQIISLGEVVYVQEGFVKDFSKKKLDKDMDRICQSYIS